MGAATVTLDGATVRFGDRVALDGFSGSFAPGSVTALIGGDGAGKSTLLKLLAGRLRLHDGAYGGRPAARREVGYQPADSGVWRNLSVAENVEFVASAYSMTPARARERSQDLLRQAGLDTVTDRLAGRLSGGMRQKLGVVLATLHEPGLVLLDEPTTGVDPISRAELWNLIASTAADGATVVFATTYLDEAERASRLFLLGDGHLLGAGTPDEVIAATPGSIWQTPMGGAAASGALTSPTGWRRANTVFEWDETGSATAPEGFEAAPGDLENTSIALLLKEGGAEASPLPFTAGAGPATGAGDTSAAPLAEAAGVGRRYGSFSALGGVSLTVGAGEIVGLLGGNGAGKTTLMRILLGLESASFGSATLFGASPSLESRRRIGYVAQGLGLYPALSAVENLEFAASVQGIEVDPDARAFATSLGRDGIGALPLGTKRILAFLAASGHRPELLVLDEPTSGMDALTRARLWRALRASADAGTGILVTTHYMQEAAQCDRVTILTSGQVTAAGTVDDITATRSSLTIETPRWEDAFTRLREAGMPALLDGRLLRLPGATADEVRDALGPLADVATIETGRATLEETMVLDARALSAAAHR